MNEYCGLKKSIIFFVRHLNLILVAVAAGFVWNNYYNDYLGRPFSERGNLDWLLVFLYITFFHLFLRLYSGYRIGSQRLTDIVYSNWLSVIITNIVIFIILTLVADTNQHLSLILLLTFGEIIILLSWAYLANKLYFSLFSPRKVIFFYEGKFPETIIEKIKLRPEKFELIDIRIFDGRKNLDKLLTGIGGVILYNISEEKSAKLITACVGKNLRYYLIPTIGDVLLKTSETTFLFDIPLFIGKNEGLYPEQRGCKRCMDVILSTAFIIALSPVMLLIALLIGFVDNGPVFYKQKRCTEGGKIFTMYKFRSMKPDDERGDTLALALEDDPRVTKIGAVLRRFRLDELPQLFNILLGSMSFVGPRPERPELMESYAKKIPEYAFRMNVKSGLTGYAQVMGGYDTAPEEKLKLDLIYIQSYSILFDIKIILMTIKIILFHSKESSRGISKKTQADAPR